MVIDVCVRKMDGTLRKIMRPVEKEKKQYTSTPSNVHTRVSKLLVSLGRVGGPYKSRERKGSEGD